MRTAIITSHAFAIGALVGFWFAIYVCRHNAMENGVGYYKDGHFHYGVKETQDASE